MKRSWIKKGGKGLSRGISLKRTKLRVAGKSDNATTKREIQSTLREYVMLRDGGCILRDIRHCGGEIGKVVIQADHLITRSNAATYADERLVVCVCKSCHGWKKWHEKEYDRLVRQILPKERVDLWDRCEEDRSTSHRGSYDWKLEILALKKELNK